LWNSSNDFDSEKQLVERICDLADGFKETANEMTHSLYHIARKKEIDEKGFQQILDLIEELEKSIK
jgi:DNA-binding ferritin-like protein (Dps family)